MARGDIVLDGGTMLAVRRLLRIVFNTLTVLSLILALLVAGLWVRSYRPPSYGWVGKFVIYVDRGIVAVARTTLDAKDYDYSVVYEDGRQSGSGIRMARQMEAIIPMENAYRWRQFSFSMAPPPTVSWWGTTYDTTLAQWNARTPIWALFTLFVVLPGGRFVLFMRGLKRARPGHCPACGYDLRATPDRCPECGAVANGAVVS